MSTGTNPVPSEPSDKIVIETIAMTSSPTSVVLAQTSPTTASVSVFGPLPVCTYDYSMILTTNGKDGPRQTSKTRPTQVNGLAVGNSYSVTVSIETKGQAGSPITSNIVKFASSFEAPPQTDNSVEVSAAVSGQDGNNQVYDPSLENKNSPEFIAISNNLCNSMATFISNAPGNLWVSNCSVSKLTPGSVMALTNMVVSQLQKANSSATKAFDPQITISSGMARTSPSQVALLLDSTSLKANTSEVIRPSTVAPSGTSSTTSTNTAAVLCMQLFIAIAQF
ncbi:hypothetical protein Ciccas_013016 [Cichlidogyrus casuarinus]|uniref:SEA domain-containing protein n=1 Tax=Cichlidogyrus casuarinus TaxID=1844966 RepID=A0ABD2PLQ1_9PLAT